MRVDVVTIFPEYFGVLDLSLVGRARTRGLLDLRVHDLRRWTDDVHRTVDDTPYGGGPGMVMRPEPWGRALDELVPPGPTPLLVVPTPGGRVFDQRVAEEYAARDWLLVACGRYEGIDARVMLDARRRMGVDEVSVGDFVLAGGELAALVVLEAVTRLVPGVLGNPQSAADESFAVADEPLLEGPVYTRPPQWRGLAVPPVLLSGDHAAIRRHRREEAQRRTARVRPDLLPGATGEAGGGELSGTSEPPEGRRASRQPPAAGTP